MRRSTILNALQKFLTEQNINSCFEILIDPQEFGNRQIEKRRSAIVVGLPMDQEHALGQFLENQGLDMNQTFIEPYANLAALQQSTRIDVNESRLEMNWRGRVLRFGVGAEFDFNFNSPADVFERMFLKSYFRLIISRVNGDYFGKHDISPIFFSPGSSTAGFEDFRYAVDGVVKFVTRGAGSPWSPADPDFDYLKAFVSRDRGVPYQNVQIANQDEVSIRNLFEMVADMGVDAVVNQFYQDIQPSFAVNP